MARLERPKKGEKITHEWTCALVDAILDLQHHPKVIAPLMVKDGSVGLGETYGLRLVKTTTTINAASGTTMGTGTAQFQSSRSGTMAAAVGTNVTRPVRSVLLSSVASGKYGYVAWVNGEWHLVAVQC